MPPPADAGRYTIETFRLQLTTREQPTFRDVTHVEQAVRVLREIFSTLDADQEHAVLLALNGRHRITGYKVLSSGGMTDAGVDLKVTFRAALVLGAVGLIFAHNHPSGTLTPSPEDREVTRSLQQAAKLLGFRLLDSIILTDQGHYSFATSGELAP
jgi:DNA repair protein RadC